MTSPALNLASPHRHESLVELLEREFGVESPGAVSGARGVPRRLWRAALHAPLEDFLVRPGSHFRAEIVSLFFRLGGSKAQMPIELSFFVEALHAGSLIVDDIEDDSSERRGEPALHRRYGTPVALNAGNWLYFWAFRLLEQAGLDRKTELTVSRLAHRTLLDCHYGQALDLSVRASQLSQHEVCGVVRAVTELKTGSLVAMAATLGAVAGGASGELVAAAARAGRDFGVALQMLDDLSGVAHEARFAKGLEDLLHDRPTWIWVWLAALATPEEFEVWRERSRAASPGDLGALMGTLRERVAPHGVRFVETFLDETLSCFAAAKPPDSVLAPLRREMKRLVRRHG